MTYLYADHLGTSRIGTDASKAITWRYPSDAFGVGTPSGTASVRLRLPGQIDLGILGIGYNYHRHYDPHTGRYVQSDPIGLAGGLNTYLYANGNPLSYIDPLGLAGCNIGFVGYPITVPGTSIKVPLIHAGVLSYNAQGRTRYYEYGRYDSDYGEVKRRSVPDLKLDQEGKPTPESWTKMLERLKAIGHGTKPRTSCDADADAEKINLFAEDRMHDPKRAPYSWNLLNMNTCTTFASDALDAGR